MTLINDENAPIHGRKFSYHRSSLMSSDSRNSRGSSSSRLASKVFGDLVEIDDVETNSLSYSPSPLADRKNFMNRMDRSIEKPMPKAFSFDNIDKVSKPRVKKDTKQPSNTKKKVKALPKNKTRMKKQDILPKPPPKAHKMKETLKAVTTANDSVNQALNLVRKAKKEAQKEIRKETSKLREERRMEKEEAASFHAEAEKTRREVLELRSQITKQFSRAKANDSRYQQQKRLGEITGEIEFKSQIFRDHKKAIKEEEDLRRRRSIAVRDKIRREKKAAQVKFRLTKIEEEHESYELKWAGEKDAEEYKKDMAEERRRSFTFRHEEGKRQREEEEQRNAEDQYAEHESYELKWAGEKDAEEYKKQMAEERRRSFSFRHEEGKRKRDVQAQLDSEEHQQEHESYELKWAGEKDAEEYKKDMLEERRRSFAFRHVEGKRKRDVQAQVNSEEHQEEHESYELKWAGEKDAEEYKKDMAEERRRSFAFRHEEGKRKRDVQAQLDSEDQYAEHESYELKWAGEKDAEEYKKQMAEERRRSFAFRHEEGKRQREEEEQRNAEDQYAEHESYELKWAGEKDAEEYKKQMAALRRESFAQRNVEGKMQRDVMNELLALAKEEETESYILQWAGENDVKAYLKEEAYKRRQSTAFRNKEAKRRNDIDNEKYSQEVIERAFDEEIKAGCQKDVEKYVEECKRRKRMSLACRAKQHRFHRAWDRAKEEKLRQIRHENTRNEALDRKYMKLAEDKERIRKALDALKRPTCTFVKNPFASILD